MILDQLFEDDKKKKLNEVDPRNFDSDEDYYAAVRGKRSSSDDDYDYEPEDDINDMDDDESYYEKSLRSRGLGEDEQLDELSLDQIGRGIGSAARGVSRAVGGLAGGIAGIPSAVKSGYSDAKKYVGGNSKNDAVSQTDDDYKAKAKAQQPWGIAAINPETGKQWLPSEVPDYVEPKDVTQAKKDAEIERQEQEVAAELERERLKTQMQKGERQPGDWARARELANRTIAPTDVSKNIQNWGQSLVAPKAGMQKLAKDLTSPTPSFAQGQTQAQAQPPGFNATNAMNLPGMEKYTKPGAAQSAATPNFARQNTGYSSVKMNAPTGIKLPGKPATPAVANAPRVVSGGPTPAERQALDKRIAAAAKAQPVAETVKQVKRMMETVTSRADVQRIKDYIDYHMGNNLSENAQVKRNRLISEVTQLAATRRREIARRMAQ